MVLPFNTATNVSYTYICRHIYNQVTQWMQHAKQYSFREKVDIVDSMAVHHEIIGTMKLQLQGNYLRIRGPGREEIKGGCEIFYTMR